MGIPANSGQRHADFGLVLRSYRLLTSMARPFVGLLLRARERHGKEDPARRGERFGQASLNRPAGPLVWFHAASVGETNAVLPLVTALLHARGDLSILLTTGTVTSARLAADRLPRGALHQYVPLDTPQFVRRFLDHWRPALAVFTEQEIWPNLIVESHQRAVPLALINARMSQSSFERWRARPVLARALFSCFSVVLAQSELLARQFQELGAARSIAAGNLKIDAPPPPVAEFERDRLEAALSGRPRLVAASTHEGEELIVAEAHRTLARAIDGFATIIAPRHPERGTAIAEALKAQGFSVAQRSVGALPGPRTDIYIADTIGELGTLYALSPIAFVGGSLVDKGGQNPVEAIRCGAVVLTGPHCSNFADAYRALLEQGGALEVTDAASMAARATALLRDPVELDRVRARAASALQTLSGALQRTLDALLALLPADQELKRAS